VAQDIRNLLIRNIGESEGFGLKLRPKPEELRNVLLLSTDKPKERLGTRQPKKPCQNISETLGLGKELQLKPKDLRSELFLSADN
jgi:hypothetical protein